MTDVQLTLLASPHESDAVSTALGYAAALLARGARVAVWACGNATFLTSTALELSKPRNVFAGQVDYPTSAAVAAGLLASHPDTLTWSVCFFCSAERGATDHIAGVRTRPATRYATTVAAARTALTVGRL